MNRFYIDAGCQLLEQEGDKYAIVSFDIDKFKLINDLFGMETGDDVLKHVASVIKEKLPVDVSICLNKTARNLSKIILPIQEHHLIDLNIFCINQCFCFITT